MAATGWQVRAYFDEVHHKAQESMSKVEGTTMVKESRARMIGFPIIDPAEMEEPTARFAPTPNNTPGRTMRFAFPRPARINLMEDSIDEDEHFWDADSEHVLTAAAASTRLMTIRLRTAALGSALETSEDTIGTAGTSVALPAAQVITDGSAALTKAKIVRARTILDVAVGGDRATWGPYYLLYDPADFRSLAAESDFNTLDSVSRQQLMMGVVVPGLMGFNWIPTSTLSTVSNIRQNLCWAKTAMGLGRNKGAKIRAGERSDLSYAAQLFREEKYDYVRRDDKGVVRIDVDVTQIPT